MATNQAELDEFLGGRPPSKLRRYLIWGGLAVLVLLILFGLARCFGGSSKPDYVTDAATRGDLKVTVSATGKLAPTNQVTVGSQLSGQVIKVLVDVNDRVTAGETLALIDPAQFDDQVTQAKAALNAGVAAVGQAQATLDQSNANLARFREVSRLSGGRVPAKTEMDQAVADRSRALASLNSAKANVVSAQAQLSQAQTQRVRAVIRSPVTGVVLARQVDPGQTVAASFNTPTLFVIAQDLRAMKLEVAIDEADVGQVKQGQAATFTVDAFPGKTFPAKITRVDVGSNLSVQGASSSSSSTTSSSSSTTGQVVSYAADLSVDNPDEQLRPGMTATADIVTIEKKDALLVPNAALRFTPQAASAASGTQSNSGIAGALGPPRFRRGGGDKSASLGRGAHQQVYVKQADGTLKAIDVTTGDTDGSMTEVTGGDLKPGMEVVTGQLTSGASKSGGGSRRRQSGQGTGGGTGGGQRGQ